MPNEKVIRDKFGKRLGSVTDEGRDLVARSAVGTRLGSFNKGTNSSRDRLGNKFCEGDVVATFILAESAKR
jgi:ribosomal protein L27